MIPDEADCSAQGGFCGPPDPSEHTRPVRPGGLTSAVSITLPSAPSESLCPSSSHLYPPTSAGGTDREPVLYRSLPGSSVSLSVHVCICVPLRKVKWGLSCKNSIQFYEQLSTDQSKYGRGPAKKAGGVEPEPGPNRRGSCAALYPGDAACSEGRREPQLYTSERPWTLGPVQPSSCFSSVFPSVSGTQFPCL